MVGGSQHADDGLVGRDQISLANRDDLHDRLFRSDHSRLGQVGLNLFELAPCFADVGFGQGDVLGPGAGQEQVELSLERFELSARAVESGPFGIELLNRDGGGGEFSRPFEIFFAQFQIRLGAFQVAAGLANFLGAGAIFGLLQIGLGRRQPGLLLMLLRLESGTS